VGQAWTGLDGVIDKPRPAHKNVKSVIFLMSGHPGQGKQKKKRKKISPPIVFGISAIGGESIFFYWKYPVQGVHPVQPDNYRVF
jgi:hypothetical protein